MVPKEHSGKGSKQDALCQCLFCKQDKWLKRKDRHKSDQRPTGKAKGEDEKQESNYENQTSNCRCS